MARRVVCADRPLNTADRSGTGFREWLGDFAGARDESLDDRAQRSILQHQYRNQPWPRRQVDPQLLQRVRLVRISEHRLRDDCDEPATSGQSRPKVDRISHQRRSRHPEAPRFESLCHDLVARRVGRRHQPRLVQQLGKIDLATARPIGPRRCHKIHGSSKRASTFKSFTRSSSGCSWKSARGRGHRFDRAAPGSSRLASGQCPRASRHADDLREPFDDLRKDQLAMTGRIQLSIRRCGIGQELDVPDPLLQFIECRPAARKERARVNRRLDPARAAIKQSCTQGMLQVGDHLRYRRMGDTQLAAALLRLPDLHDREEHRADRAAAIDARCCRPNRLSWPQAPAFNAETK